MSKNQRIRVAQWGLGAMGQGVAKVILAKEGLELVGAFDISPDLVGKDVGEVLGVAPAGVKV
ncbi:MAG: dihydrodipicolinate reductase, partial [Propionibacterium sp.]|nr:dihydrodipicolinate reductase [Propionibacterium sp.]